MKTFRFDIQCPSRDHGLCSGNLLLVDRGGMCVHAQLQAEDRYLNNRMVGENIFELFPNSASVPLRAGFSTLWGARKGCCEDLYECTGKGGELSVYYLISMSRYDEHHVMIRLRNISHYINKHEQLLRQEEQKVEDLKRIAGIGVWRYDSKKQRLESKGYADPVFDSDEYGVMNMEEYLSLMSVTDGEKIREYIRGLDIGRQQECIQYMIHYENRDVVLRVEPISCRPSDGGFLWEGYVQNVTDLITEQTHVEMLRQAIDSVSEDVFAVKPDGSLAFANKTFREHNAGDSRRDIEREKVFDLNESLVSKEQWDDWVKNLRENGGSWNFTQDAVSGGNGETMTFENYSYLIENKLHQELIWVFARDISERLKREDEINSLQYLMNSIINNIPVGLYVKDVADDFKYLFCNRAAFDFLQPDCEDVIGKNDFEIFGRSKAGIVRDEDRRLVSDRTKFEQVRCAPGALFTYEEIRIYSEKKDGTPLIIGVIWDITSRVALEKELVEAKEKAEESGRLKSAFLANMSHEIRTPLNAIVEFSNIIAETQDLEERRGMYKIVETNNERLLLLINEILDLSKIEAGMLELSSKPVNMQVLCGELLNANLFRCPGNVIFSFDGSSPNLVTRTDPNRLFQVFANLITNAFKFTDSGCVTFGYRLDGRDIVCYVEDTGLGIEADKQGRIFDRFVKGNDFAQGTGLGLPICKVLIEKMGGHISVESKIGKGTKFIFTIPHVPPVNERFAAGSEKSAGREEFPVRETGERKSPSDTVTVLVVESASSDFDMLCKTFGNGIFFVRAESGVEAVTLFEQYRPQLVLLNLAMTDMDGGEVAGIMKEVASETPVVAFGAQEHKVRTRHCDDSLAFPWSREKIERLFSKYL